MPMVSAQGKNFQCESGSNLRQVLLAHNVALHNGQSSLINCRGIGSCGTCAVQIEGEFSEPNWKDRTRRSLPPHDRQRNLRLACQTLVLGDVRVVKYDGFWGQGCHVLWSE